MNEPGHERETLFKKITKAKKFFLKAGVMAQMPGKCKTLSSTPGL
jgi:hypothetical protein